MIFSFFVIWKHLWFAYLFSRVMEEDRPHSPFLRVRASVCKVWKRESERGQREREKERTERERERWECVCVCVWVGVWMCVC